MADWTMLQAKRDFELGYLVGWQIERVSLGEGWHVALRGVKNRGHLIDVRSRTPRTFKTLDAAVSALTQAGFRVEGLTAC